MLDNLKLEKVWINQEYFGKSCKKTRQRKRFSHTVQFEATARNRESNPNESNDFNSQKNELGRLNAVFGIPPS